MASTEYGSVPPRTDEETPLVGERAVQEPQTCLQKLKHTLRLHGHRVFITWFIIILITAVITLTYYFSSHSNDLLQHQCVSDRSWFVALILSIFFGPFGVDRFYLGYVFLGILKLVTAGLGGIWWTIDVILIALNVLTDHPDGCHLR
ncbi:uncharacterized protein BYT42DRAFT_564741 [Radiomyces spectabilis]|uniref:uncharacterized protein n=1 Tax=Radiomyces spectabilis TaxID=64574 RepID=UPI00221EBFD1|nr:uncharacterized protein BYT42DRAFT_564741 [Radiomyces spectabilis]KAI8380947.1 hypothetical protein BYT42DRAFT_564741 [Radiomyces spectabilis]